MANTIISIIIAVYNNEKYLTNAVNSVIDQIKRQDDLEIIIVDDGSTDKTPIIADELAKNDKRIKVIHQKNQWIYASFNNGIKAAKGEYIYILNSDDKLVDGAVQKLLDSIEKYNHPDVVWTKVIWQDVDLEQNVINEHDINPGISEESYYDSRDSVRANWLFVLETGIAVNQANLYKRELALKHPFRNDYYAGDSFFNIGIANDIQTMAFLAEPIYRYMSYTDPQMNASIGKYYGYEHHMFNELMEKEISLYDGWGKKDVYLDNVVESRLKALTYEIETLRFKNCNIDRKERVAYVFRVIADKRIRQLARDVKREREYESRVLTGIRKLVAQMDLKDAMPQFARILIDYLPDNYLDNPDKSIINKENLFNAINDSANKDRIGEVYYSTDW